MYFLPLLETRILKSRNNQSTAPTETSRGEFFFTSS